MAWRAQGPARETLQGATATARMRDGGGLGYGVGGAGDEKCLDSGKILTVQVTSYGKGLNVGCEREG